MKIGIDVTWLKPSKSGGVESYFRNLLDGFLELKDDNTYYSFRELFTGILCYTSFNLATPSSVERV